MKCCIFDVFVSFLEDQQQDCTSGMMSNSAQSWASEHPNREHLPCKNPPASVTTCILHYPLTASHSVVFLIKYLSLHQELLTEIKLDCIVSVSDKGREKEKKKTQFTLIFFWCHWDPAALQVSGFTQLHFPAGYHFLPMNIHGGFAPTRLQHAILLIVWTLA